MNRLGRFGGPLRAALHESGRSSRRPASKDVVQVSSLCYRQVGLHGRPSEEGRMVVWWRSVSACPIRHRACSLGDETERIDAGIVSPARATER